MFEVIVRDVKTGETQITNKFEKLSRANRWVKDEELRLGESYFFEIKDLDEEEEKELDNKSEKFLNELERRISRLEKELTETQNNLKSHVDGDPRNILSFGLAKDAEKITVIMGKLEELYNMKDAFNFIYEV